MDLQESVVSHCNLPWAPGESLPGYLLRLAEANGYSGIREFLCVAAELPGKSLRAQLLQLRAEARLLARVAGLKILNWLLILGVLFTAYNVASEGQSAAEAMGLFLGASFWLLPSVLTLKVDTAALRRSLQRASALVARALQHSAHYAGGEPNTRVEEQRDSAAAKSGCA